MIIESLSPRGQQYYLREIQNALREAREYIEESSEKNKIIYFPDFNLIYPYLYKESKERFLNASHHMIDMIGSAIISMISNYDISDQIDICISIPTIMEMMFSLQRKHNFFSRIENRNISFLNDVRVSMEKIKSGDLKFDQIENKLINNFILESEKIHGFNNRYKNFIGLLHKKKISMLYKHYEINDMNNIIRNKKDVLDEIEQSMRRVRGFKDGREESSRIISYKADAYNIFITYLSESSEKDFNFICSHRFQEMTPNRTLLQHQKSPLHILILICNFIRINESCNGKDKHFKRNQLRDFFSENEKKAAEYRKYLTNYSEISHYKRRSIYNFIVEHYVDYIEMAKAKSYIGNVDSIFDYNDYLEIIGDIKNKYDTLHDQLKDKKDDDDIYRDFISTDKFNRFNNI